MLNLDSPSAIKILESLIRDIVQQEISKNAPFNRMIPATVVDLTGDLLNVKLNGDDEIISGIINKTGETVIANDQVWILKINNSSSNLVATIKK